MHTLCAKAHLTCDYRDTCLVGRQSYLRQRLLCRLYLDPALPLHIAFGALPYHGGRHRDHSERHMSALPILNDFSHLWSALYSVVTNGP
jgi:hypothetical protein